MINEKMVQNYKARGSLIYQSIQVETLLKEGKISLAKKIILELLEKDPDDYPLNKQLSRCYIYEKEYEKAVEILERIDQKKNFKVLAALYIKMDTIESKEKLFHLYQTVFKVQNEDPTNSNPQWQNNYRILKIYTEKLFNPNFQLKRCELPYTERQFYHYSEQDALIHIYENHKSSGPPSKSRFSNEIQIKKLYHQASDYILQHKEEGILRRNDSDQYVFYLPSCGLSRENIVCNYIKVLTIINEAKILTMYPCLHQCGIQKVNRLEEKRGNQKVKSGLERFQSRYHQEKRKID